MRLINNIIEPRRLLVVWQAPDQISKQPIGSRFIVGEILKHDDKTILKYFDNEDIRLAKQLGFTGLTSYPYEPNKEFSGNLIDVLSRRLPPSVRADYEDYLRSFRIPPAAVGISTLALLGYTTGKLAGDGFTFVHTFDNAKPPFDFTFEIAGFRHNGLLVFPDPTVLQDKEIQFQNDSTNIYDSDALAVEYNGTKLGYVPKGLNIILKKLLERYRGEAFIEKINGSKERPNILVFVKVK